MPDRPHGGRFGGRRILVATSLLLIAYWLVGFGIATTQEWPGEFDTDASDDPQTFWQWVVRGSLLAPPLVPFVVQVVATYLVTARRPAWVLGGGAVLFLLGIVFAIGALGEPLDPKRSNPPQAFYLAFRALGLALVAALLATAASTIRERAGELRRRREQP